MDNYKEMMEAFKKQNIITKQGVLDFVNEMLDMIKELSEDDTVHSMAYYRIIYKLFDEFIEKIKSVELMENMDGPWCYEVGFNSKSICLEIDYCELYGFTDDGILASSVKNSFTLIEIHSKLLSVDEYAKIYDVGVGTVRQWIRRGKIRTAIKEGNEWRIPELTEKPTRGFDCGMYGWKDEIHGLPKKYEFINDYDSVTIDRDMDDNKLYHAYFHGEFDKEQGFSKKNYDYQMDRNEVEKLELVLISNKDIEYKDHINNTFRDALYKRLKLQEVFDD